MNLVIFASDNKGLSSLNSIINEASNRNINIFVMISQDTQLRYPLHHPDRFQILTNCESTNPHYSKTLGVELPFKPDWLIINRERWEPESSIIMEFKNKFNSKIGVVEPNCWILGSIETILEMHSLNRFIPYIDVYFDHSTLAKEQKELQGFKGKSVIVGNPKYDINLEIDKKQLQEIKEYYKIDPNKKQVLLFSLQNSNRNNIFKEYEKYIQQNPQHQYFIKPYPGEPFGEKYHNDYFPKFKIKGVTPILEETHIWSMFNICDIHIGCIMSILHASLLLNKEIVCFDKEINIPQNFIDVNKIIEDKGIGLEDSSELWMRSFNMTKQEVLNLLSEDLIEKIKNKNNKIWNTQDNLLHLFDDFNDRQAGKRIIDYILKS
tara:strand:- start:10900 stop:12033 length:1134 start_codon:yes stop_codon:yes gene_type:complete